MKILFFWGRNESEYALSHTAESARGYANKGSQNLFEGGSKEGAVTPALLRLLFGQCDHGGQIVSDCCQH